MWLHFILIFYILLVGMVFGSGNQNRKKKIIYLVLTFGIFVMLSALRSNSVGNDTSAYLRLFSNISISEDISRYSWRYESGYLWLNKILSLVSANPQIILVVTSIIIMGGYARFIYKYSNNVWLSVYLFFTLGYFGMSMNTVRLNIAIVIILYSYDFLREKKLFKFALTVILASLFHRTAIVFIVAWIINKFKINYKTISLTAIGSVILYVAFPAILKIVLIFFPTYQYYMGSAYLDGSTRFASVMNFFVGLSIVGFGMYTRYQKKKIRENNTTLLLNDVKNKINDAENMLLLLLASVAITFSSFNFSLLDRAGNYFFVFAIVYIPNAIRSLRDKNLKVLITFVLIILFFAYATIIKIMRPEWNIIYPYRFYWN